MKSRHWFCPLMCLHTHRQNHHHHLRPAVHSNDVIHIHRSACKARSAFTRLISFLSLSLHHHLSASSLFPCFFLLQPLSISSSHVFFFPPACFSPLLCWLTLFYPLFSCSSSPLAFWGLRTISVFQADVLALLCFLCSLFFSG